MNSYKDLALYDLEAARVTYEHGLWNKAGRECQQACEKYLKHYLQQNHLLSLELGRTHNLKKLLRAVPGFNPELLSALSIVGDYYFETNYPGDNFIELDEAMAAEALETARALIDHLDGLSS